MIFRTIKEMFIQRGYTNVEDTKTSITAIKQDGDKICAFKTVFSKFDMDDFRNCVGTIQNTNISHVVVVFDEITPAAKGLLTRTADLRLAAGDDKFQMESFFSKTLKFNLTKHRLYCPHEKIPANEAVKIMDKYQAIKITDPVVHFFGWKKGDLIKITRKTGIPAYRIVKK